MIITGIIGDPIRLSLSPAMHNAAYRKMGLPFIYLPFLVTPRQLPSFIKDLRIARVAGLNVTIPHKERVLKYLDWISPEARAIGAVNTIVCRGGKLLGYNTDGRGYLRSLKDEIGFSPRGKKILILGSGGAARALVHALGSAGSSEIYIANRTPSRASRLVKEFQRLLRRTRLNAVPLTQKSLQMIFPRIDRLTNATSVGLNKTLFKGLPLASLSKKAIVSDLVYRPLMTPLLQEARRRKLKVHTGIGMLLHQGAESFRLWTGKRPDLTVMKRALLDALK